MFQPVAFSFGSSLPQKEATMVKGARENPEKPESEKLEKLESTQKSDNNYSAREIRVYSG